MLSCVQSLSRMGTLIIKDWKKEEFNGPLHMERLRWIKVDGKTVARITLYDGRVMDIEI